MQGGGNGPHNIIYEFDLPYPREINTSVDVKPEMDYKIFAKQFQVYPNVAKLSPKN